MAVAAIDLIAEMAKLLDIKLAPLQADVVKLSCSFAHLALAQLRTDHSISRLDVALVDLTASSED